MTRGLVLALVMGLTFVAFRLYLHQRPDTDLVVAGYGVHHLFTGLVLVAAGGIPAVLLPHGHRGSTLALAIFGVGLAMTLDEWLYLIATDGTNAAYLLPVSFWGGLTAVVLAMAYAVIVGRRS
ncbi:MAG: hypothetical protein ACT4QD_11005 [Acidobacteriota bacterium]